MPPLNPDTARHTPENGFIVNKVQAWVISPAGEKSKIAVRYFIQDSERNLQAALFPDPDPEEPGQKAKDPDPSAFAALPKLFRTRWIVAVLAEPLRLADGSRIQVDLKQEEIIDSKPALIQRVRLAASGDAVWTSLSQDPARAPESRPSPRA